MSSTQASAKPPFFVGIDSGSWNTKAALIDGKGKLLATAIVRTGAELLLSAEQALNLVLSKAGMSRTAVQAIWSTGFGRHAIGFAQGSRTELDAHVKGALQVCQPPFTLVDIGGQDAKVICVDGDGHRISHKMNRKCAAGTGSFLEEIALRLNTNIEGLPPLAAQSTEAIELGSFCTVFTGTELLSLIRQGKRPADLAAAAYRSVVKRVLEMERLEGRLVATGGVVAHHPMVVALLSAAVGTEVMVPPHPQEMGAFGAAIAARSSAQ